MKRFCNCLVVVISICVVVSLAWCGDKPDFTNPDAVLKDIRAKIDECGKSGCKDCMAKCGYALKTLKNFLKANPGGDPGILKQRWQPCYEAHRDADLKTAGSPATEGMPDFRNHEAVVASLKALRAKCGNDGACIKECDYVLGMIHNYRHDNPHFVTLRRSKWESCRNKVPGAIVKVAKKPSCDRSKFVVSGLQLGGDMNTQKNRFFLLEAYGFHKKTTLEHSDWILRKGESKPGPDLIRNYKGSIREAPVYIHFEATGDGRIYMIQFEQKKDMEVDDVKAALIKRYGKPSKQHGNYIYWGCDRGPQEGFCVKANVSARALTIWAHDEDIKNAAYNAYRKDVLRAKGVKSGAKF
ncbi:MAG: hypothetical protein BA865_07655 [Desulfobacterales bacterium S5133MH4]|nr:MAG: hypothetical protein BA865_07655 [Desulfobacterales bacterium S5133MH4]